MDSRLIQPPGEPVVLIDDHQVLPNLSLCLAN
jgi:hypothetical protein